jgi:hypothetical protein
MCLSLGNNDEMANFMASLIASSAAPTATTANNNTSNTSNTTVTSATTAANSSNSFLDHLNLMQNLLNGGPQGRKKLLNFKNF